MKKIIYSFIFTFLFACFSSIEDAKATEVIILGEAELLYMGGGYIEILCKPPYNQECVTITPTEIIIHLGRSEEIIDEWKHYDIEEYPDYKKVIITLEEDEEN